MNADLINDNVQPLYSNFRLGLINELWIVCTPNRNYCTDLCQACQESTNVCLVWIRPTYNFLQHPRSSISINKSWYNQCQSTKTLQHTNNYKLIYWNHNHTLSLMGYLSLRLLPVIANITRFPLIHKIGWKICSKITHVMPMY